ncbi:hypothetical protein CALCODRAFT_502484 [Calocera cornea HHB12733]|uniref:BHLH domain-containing protein n=1 Tax=Calocera cornea HHB12733 TaxID=1353952 RepID=A0A165D8J1_9BASI|nr:hypothetical protein CALCODRAFT_502484 [Calocera cornea HHB12733]
MSTLSIDPGLEGPSANRHSRSQSRSRSRGPSAPPPPGPGTTSTAGAPNSVPPPTLGSVEHILHQLAAVDEHADADKQRHAAKVLTAALQTGQRFETPLGTLGHEQILQLLAQLPQAVSRAVEGGIDGGPPLPPPPPPASTHHQHTPSNPPRTPGNNDRSSPEFDSPMSPDSGRKKPQQGSEEWARQRKDNHKEVERRRRGNINDGITELARIVPNGEKNKGAVLQRAVQYIHQLKENEARNIEKWTLEKLLMDQAMGDLQAQLEETRKRWDSEREERERLARRVEELEARLEALDGREGSEEPEPGVLGKRGREDGESADGKRQRVS